MKRQSLVLALLVATIGCASPYRISALGDRVDTGDGHHVWTYRLARSGEESARPKAPRAIVFYVPGSGYSESVLNVMGAMAGFVMMGMPVILVERRGLEAQGESDPALARQFSDKPTRVGDVLAAMRSHLAGLSPATPVVLVGDSEGADVAARVAKLEPRVTELILLGGGGGMCQADELRLLARRDPALLGVRGAEELEGELAAIRASPESDREWLGHPYRRWSSFLWSPPVDDLVELSIPVFLAHGAADTSVPVESARQVREAFAARGKSNLDYLEYPGLDHSFRDRATGESGLPFVEVDLVAWFRDQRLLSDQEAAHFVAGVRRAHPRLFEGR